MSARSWTLGMALAVLLTAIGGCPGGSMVETSGAGTAGGCSAPACPAGSYPVCEQGAVEAECCEDGALALRCSTPTGFLTNDCPTCAESCTEPVDGGPPTCCAWGGLASNPCFPDGG